MHYIKIHPRDMAATRWRTVLSCLIIAFLFVLFWSLLSENHQRSLAHHRLESTPGTITSVDLPTGLEYEFSVEGQNFTGRHGKLIPESKYRGVPRNESKAMASQWAKEQNYQVDQQTVVFYDPVDPNVHCLSAEHPKIGIVTFIVAPWILLAFTAGFIGWIILERFKIEFDK
ncbi:MAG: DUF3592 domain-containing protein [Planctomycetota bacterium]